jgi:hypothetical protein
MTNAARDISDMKRGDFPFAVHDALDPLHGGRST